MTTKTTSTSPSEGVAPVISAGATDEIAAPAAADPAALPDEPTPPEGGDPADPDEPTEATNATDEPDEPGAVAPAAPGRPAPAGASDVADALRAARAEQRRADGNDEPAAAPPAAPAIAATAQPDLAHPELAPEAPTSPAPAEGGPAAPAEESDPDDVPAAAAVALDAADAALTDAALPDAPAADAVDPDAEAPAPALQAVPATYDELIASLDEPRRLIVDEHISGLKTALQAERTTVKKLEAQAKAAQTLAEERARLEGTAQAALAAEVASAQAEAAIAQGRATFYEHAVDQGVRRKSVRLAYLAALDSGHLQADGSIRWDEIRDQFSDLFESPGHTSPTPPSRSSSAAAGAGARADTPAAPTLNQIIRTAAGRR